MKCNVSKSIDLKNIFKNIQSFPLLWLYSAEEKKSKREDPRNNENLSGGVLPRVVKILTLFQT